MHKRYALFRARRAFDYSAVPRVTFTDPKAARILTPRRRCLLRPLLAALRALDRPRGQP